MLKKIKIAPGINKEGTQYAANNMWHDGDLVRFRKGRVEKIGGWRLEQIQTTFNGETTGDYRGVCRSLYDWGVSGGERYLGIGTNTKFYVENGSALNDVTPLRSVGVATANAFSATDGSSTVDVAHTSHGAVAGDYVTFASAVGLGGTITAAVLNHEYKIDSITDNDNYKITARDTSNVEVTANASDTGDGGAATTADYQINVGTNSYLLGTGFGVGLYSDGLYGGGGALSFAGQLRLWTQDEFGDDLVINPRNGGVFLWDESLGVGERARDLTNATYFPTATEPPEVAFQVMVSPVSRHVICFGANNIGESTIDPLLIRWSSQENSLDWNPTAINTAGGQVLSTGTSIVGAVKTRQEILIFTDTSVHTMRFTGAPFVFSFAVVGENLSTVSPQAAVPVGDAVYFMDLEGFYVYQGSIRRVRCDVLDHVYTNLNRGQLFKVFAVTNPDNAEIRWHYPIGTGNTDNTDYVAYNYEEDVWSVGKLSRGAWIQAKTRSYPIASSNDIVNVDTNDLFSHEFEYDNDTVAMLPYIESSGLSIDDGESIMFIRRIVPDFRYLGNENNVSFTVRIMGRDYPQDDMLERDSVTITAATRWSDVRVRAREIALRVEGTGKGYGWTMGDFRFDIRTDGKRE